MSAVTGFILGAFGFKTGKEDKNALYQTAKAILGVKVTFIFIPLVLVAIMYICIFTYKMTAEDHKMIKDAIQEKKEKGKCTLTPNR